MPKRQKSNLGDPGKVRPVLVLSKPAPMGDRGEADPGPMWSQGVADLNQE
jgi:hypothetical protein